MKYVVMVDSYVFEKYWCILKHLLCIEEHILESLGKAMKENEKEDIELLTRMYIIVRGLRHEVLKRIKGDTGESTGGDTRGNR